jgi:thiol-disulfide isomerase/thioredoxin
MNDTPLTNADYQGINQALYKLNKAKLAIESAKRAGVDVSEHCVGCDYVEQRLQQLKQEYFRNKP